MSEKVKVLLVASECNPYAKSGGLGDVIGSLPKELTKKDVDIRVVIPKYSTIKDDLILDVENVANGSVDLDFNKYGYSVFLKDDGIKVYMIENHSFFSRESFYGYDDDYLRFAFFTKAALAMLPEIDFKPDVINFNDWQSALGPLYLRDVFGGYVFYNNIKSVYTIHNIQYQGVFGREVLDKVGLNQGYFTEQKLEFFNAINFMKAGILYADKVSTVSKTYANEIQTPEYGYNLDGILRERSYKVLGIVNGIDLDENNPEIDEYIYKNFEINSLQDKKVNKKMLQQELGLEIREDVPIISIITRLADQKGIDLIERVLYELLSKDVQVVVLGTGEKKYEDMLKHYEYHNKNKMSANIFFSNDLAHKIYASTDLFLMPSLFEPCGLSQIFAMRYGTVPIVRNTGGLSDTVTHYNKETGEGNGFKFNNYDSNGLMWAINEALSAYNSDYFEEIVKNAMKSDFSWQKSAKEYKALYEELKSLKY